MQKQVQVKICRAEELPPNWFKRQKADPKTAQQLEDNVKAIVCQVKEMGDKALIEFAEKFDKAKLTLKTLKVRKEESKKPSREPALTRSQH